MSFSSGFRSLYDIVSELETTFLYLDIHISLCHHLNNIHDSCASRKEAKLNEIKNTQKKDMR